MASVIDFQTRHTLQDLVNRGEFDGYRRVLDWPTCPICKGPMRRDIMRRPRGLLRGEDVKIVYQCRDEYCGQAEVLG